MSLGEDASQTKSRKYMSHSESSEDMKEDDLETKSTNFFPLLALPDDELLLIFGFLDPRDLANLSRSCERLSAVARYRPLWSKVDLRNHYMMLCQLKDFAEYLNSTTKFIASRGCASFFTESNPPSQNCSSDVLKVISGSCGNLETLVLEEHYFDPRMVFAYDFLSGLKCLSLKDCKVYSEASESTQCSYFHGIECQLPSLEILILDGCDWITGVLFVHVSKCPNLRVLSMKSCCKMKSRSLFNYNIVKRGFKSLQILDFRGTFISPSDFTLSSCIESLTHLLVEQPRPRDAEKKNGEGSLEPRLPAGVACTCRSKAGHAEPEGAVEGHRCLDELLERRRNAIINVRYIDCQLCEQRRHMFVKVGQSVHSMTLISDSRILFLGLENRMSHSLFNFLVPVASHTFNHHLTHLVIKNYKGVTDCSLEHLSLMSSLKYLDVRGTSVTPSGVSSFRTKRGDAKLESDYDLNANDENNHAELILFVSP